MPEDLTDRKCCHKCLHTVTGKRKLSKCARCHSITYCGLECQREDWPRHREFCIPVMVTEIPGKGLGLVASKNFKKGELIFKEIAAISVKAREGAGVITLDMALEVKNQVQNMSDEQKSKFYKLKPQKESFNSDTIGVGITANCLEELLIVTNNGNFSSKESMLALFINSPLINHSCAPNAVLGKVPESAKGMGVIALRDISKGEEITQCYIRGLPKYDQSEMRKRLKEEFQFDCECTVCSGETPNQDRIIFELALALCSIPFGNDRQRPIDVSKLDKAIDFTNQLYIGHLTEKEQIFSGLVVAAQLGREPVLLKKALDSLKGQSLSSVQGQDRKDTVVGKLEEMVERWAGQLKSKCQPTEEEVDNFHSFIASSIYFQHLISKKRL